MSDALKNKNPIDPLTGRPKMGRPPKHPGMNQYTGVKAQNINWVRQMLRKFIEDILLKEDLIVFENPTARQREAIAARHKTVMWACRLLLACEGVYLFSIKSALEHAKAQKRLVELGHGVREGSVSLPSLLAEIDELERVNADEGFEG